MSFEPASGWWLGAIYGPDEVDLAGDPASLDALGRLLQNPPRDSVAKPLVARDPGPYDGFLESLVLKVGSGEVVIRRDGTVLAIEGGREPLKTFGRNIAWFAANEDPSDRLAHMHQEHVPVPHGAHPWHIAEEAIPLVVSFF